MFSKELAKKVIDEGLKTGADFVEVFYEDTYSGSIKMLSNRIDAISTNETYGVGIRILRGVEEIYGYTNEVNEKSLVELARKLASAFSYEPLNIKYELKEEVAKGVLDIKETSKETPIEKKIALIKDLYKVTSTYSEKIIQTIVVLQEKTQEVIIANSNGRYVKDLRNPQRLAVTAIARSGDKNQSNSETVGGNFGFDGYQNKDLKAVGLNVAKAACVMVDADEMVGGVYPVIIHNGFGGVLFHEACGHPLEASSVAPGLSVFSGKKGTKIASSVVTAVDDGSIYNEWGSLNVDDEGTPTKKNVLIKDGILTAYMTDFRNIRRMENEELSGNSRRESYKYSPTSRMTNTYIANGESTFEEIIANTKYGLFAKSLGGGSVNPTTGEFNFAVNEGYMVIDGKIDKPVRGATLIGNGANALLNIDMVANNQTFGHGMCGASSGSICANVGEPTIRIQNMTVGGAGGNK